MRYRAILGLLFLLLATVVIAFSRPGLGPVSVVVHNQSLFDNLANIPTTATTPRMKSMKDRREATFREMMRAVNAGDATAYANLYAFNAIIEIVGSETLVGRKAIEKYEVDLLTQFPGTKFRIEKVWLHESDRAVAQYGVSGAAADGRPMGHEGLLFYEFGADGLIIREERFLDSFTPMAQLGAFGPGPHRPVPKLTDSMSVHKTSSVRGRHADLERLLKLIRKNQPASERTVSEVFTETAVLDDLTETEARVGVKAIQHWFSEWSDAVAGGTTTFLVPLVTGDGYILQTSLIGTLSKDRARVHATGQKICLSRVWLIEMKNGRINRVWVFMNSKELTQPATCDLVELVH